MKKNKYTVLLIALLLKSVIAVSQNSTNEKKIVSDFVKEIFFAKETAKEIADQYIYFLPTDKPNYSIDDRIEILQKHLEKIKEDKSTLLDPADYYIVAYNQYQGIKITFSKKTEDIYILVSKGSPVMYFYLENERIASFDYITKGEEGFFITY